MTLEAELLDLSVEIATEAGALAHQRRREGVSIAASKSSLADIVTEADREVEQLIRDRLDAARPDDGFLGEESEAHDGSSGITWVVDPIDGTVNYAAGIPMYAVSIAAVTGGSTFETWTALSGVVRAPALDETFTATRGGGAFVNGTQIRVSEASPAGALMATGFGYDPATHEGDLMNVARVMPIVRDLRRMGAASLDLAFVAAGRLDGYFERGLKSWDFAAGALLVEEAGGFVERRLLETSRPMICAGRSGLVSDVFARLAV